MNNLKVCLYQKTILHYNKNPLNLRVMSDASKILEGNNHMCGDWIKIYIMYDKYSIKQLLQDVSFQAEGCAVLKASASIMTAFLKDKPHNIAIQLARGFIDLLKGEGNFQIAEEYSDDMRAFINIADYPGRYQCAALPWETILRETHLHGG